MLQLRDQLVHPEAFLGANLRQAPASLAAVVDPPFLEDVRSQRGLGDELADRSLFQCSHQILQ